MIAGPNGAGKSTAAPFVLRDALEVKDVRVAEGGHDIPERVVRCRFEPGLRNFLTRYSGAVDLWSLYDARLSPPTPIASRAAEGPAVAHQRALWKSIRGSVDV